MPNASVSAAMATSRFKIEHFPEAGIVFTRRIVQLEFVAEPGIVGTKDVAEPIEYKPNWAGV